jgi:hypothetical protein
MAHDHELRGIAVTNPDREIAKGRKHGKDSRRNFPAFSAFPCFRVSANKQTPLGFHQRRVDRLKISPRPSQIKIDTALRVVDAPASSCAFPGSYSSASPPSPSRWV